MGTCPNYNVLVYNYAEDKNTVEHNPFIGFEWNEDIPNPKLRQHFNDNLEKVAFYAFKTYGLHTHKTHTRVTWRKVEQDWLDNGDNPLSQAKCALADEISKIKVLSKH